MVKLEKYESYKESGVKWLGKIPEEWEVKKIKHLFKLSSGRVVLRRELDEDGMFPVYSAQTINNGILGYIKTYDYDCEQITWSVSGANAGTVFLRKGKYSCTSGCGMLQRKNKDENLEFITYSLQIATQFYKRPDIMGAKVMNYEMAEIQIAYPPKQIQAEIVSFLNEKTAQIDTVISQKEIFINLLKTYRQNINKVITKSLSKNAEFKGSDVEGVKEAPRNISLSEYNEMVDETQATVSNQNIDINKEYSDYFYLNLDNKKNLESLYNEFESLILKDSLSIFKTFVSKKSEQNQITECIKAQTAKIDKVIELQQKCVAKIKEYKVSLINSVVTGKIKVV